MASATTTTTTTSTRPRLRTRLAFIATSLVLSLVLAEGMASLVHHGAFPYLNIFQADPALGVRLRPNASTRIRSRSGRLTDIRTNALGYRGDDWKNVESATAAIDQERSHVAAVPDRVVLLGDSQMFGYNVPEEAALTAQLQARSGGQLTILNAAVPTWGPPDYVIALREIAPKYHPRFVLFVANAANDWFEPVPNRRRTSAIDGWVTRAAPGAPGAAEPQWFPFRGWLMGQSHLVFGVRQVTSYVASEGQPPSSQSAIRLKTDLTALRRGTSTEPHHRSTITPNLKAAVDACAEVGCEVIAVALPTDVQVSAGEWLKYRGTPNPTAAAPVDLTDTEALLEDFVADARDLGIRAVNLLAPLRAAEPGAFLDDDYHLSAKGHRVVADVLMPILRSEQTAHAAAGASATPPSVAAGEHRP